MSSHQVSHALKIAGLVLLVALMIMTVVVSGLYLADHIKHRKEGFSPEAISNYKAELNLFKSMSPTEQTSYLNMDKAQKLAVYGDRLLGH